MQFMLELEQGHWQSTIKTDKACIELADRHYSRKTVGASQFTRPGENLVFRKANGQAVWVTWRSRFPRKDNFGYAWECTIFRNESEISSSLLIKEAIEKTIEIWGPLPEDGLVTYVDPVAIKSSNPGYSFLKAGFKRLKHRSTRGLSLFHLTNSSFKQAIDTSLKAEVLEMELECLYEAIQAEDADFYSLLYEISEKLIDYWITVKSMKKDKNMGFPDVVFKLESFFNMYGELEPELEEIFYRFKWN